MRNRPSTPDDRYQALFDHVSDGVTVWRYRPEDQVFVLAAVNEAGQKRLGIDAGAIGRTPRALWPAADDHHDLDALLRRTRPGQPAQRDTIKAPGLAASEVTAYRPEPDAVVVLWPPVGSEPEKQSEKRLQAALNDAQQRRTEVEALLEAAQSIMRQVDSTAIAQNVLTLSRRLLGARAGCLGTYDADGRHLTLLSTCDDAQPPWTFPASLTVDGPLADVRRGHRPLICNDLTPAARPAAGRGTGRLPFRNAVFTPMAIGANTHGVLCLGNKPDGFTDNDARMLQVFGELAAISLSSRRTIEKLAHSRARFQLLIEKNADAIMLIDKKGIIRMANPAAVHFFGRSSAALLGLPFGLPLTADETTEIDILRPDGLTAAAELRMVETEWDGSEVYLATIRDIGERRRAEVQRLNLERQLQQAQKMEALGTLAGGISHDFNNILSAVIGFTELSLTEAPEGSTLKDNLNEVLTAGRRARDLVRQILAFSRQSAHATVAMNPGPLVKEVVKLLRASLPTTIEISQRIDTDAAVMADPTQIHQILLNLCTNAGYAMGAGGGRLTIEVAEGTPPTDGTGAGGPSGHYLRLSVIDNGPGIKAAIMEKLFDPFFTTKPSGEGTGMGLAVVYGIVQAHGGTISVASRPDEETRFDIFLPVVDADGELLATETERDAPASGSGRILCVDDERSIALLEQRMLENSGYEVTTAGSGSEALALFESAPERFDLLITDLTMPRMTGDRLAAHVLAIRPDIPVLLCTGYQMHLDRGVLATLGIREIIMKPIDRQALTAAVHQALQKENR